MGEDCLEICLSLELTADEKGSVASGLKAYDSVFQAKNNYGLRDISNQFTNTKFEARGRIDEFVKRLRKMAASTCV